VVQFAPVKHRYHIRPALILALPPEALELEVEIVGRAFKSILSKRRTAYEELAQGPDK
jgi:hypothetical protein